ncbi:PstS family phosphate ABC transporter substrate-binding protein [Pontiellaceae bacterium B12219]|nr:PstS family phosphate ABC transporter substrate-binding protein [Pontiellaceae bacterium B12219]
MRTMKTKTKATMLTALALCTSAGLSQAQSSALQGNVVVDGSSTVYPVSEAAAAAFRKDFPNVNVTIAISGTGGGFKRFVKGETDVSDASRPIKAKEFEEARANGIEFIEVPICLDGLSVIVNPENDWLDQLTVEDIQAIYLEDGTVRSWSDLNPAWPDKPIKVYSPGTDSGTFDYFKEVVVPEGKSFRSDMSTSEDDNVLVTGVAGDKYSIGYFGAAYYFENRDKLKAVPIVNPKTGKAVLPEPENVISGEYAPLSRPLFIYVNSKSLRKPSVRKFLEFYVGRSGEFAEQVDYVSLPDDVIERTHTFVKNRYMGTVYLTPELEKREGSVSELYQIKNLVNTK